VEFVFCKSDSPSYEIDTSVGDIYITTSWWTTYSTLESISASQIIYILQEDERMFYPYGDDHLLCHRILRSNDLRYVINTKLLYDFLVSTGLPNLEARGSYFEPAFVPHSPSKQPIRLSREKSKRKFFFYARPYNTRNLFYLGIEVVRKAVLCKLLDPHDWEIYFVGKDLKGNIPNSSYFFGLSPILVENLSFENYIDFVGKIDLGLSLMYTPHPSYPPLDLAASGAVVVTNKFANKENLYVYSKNILCRDLDIYDLLEGMKEAIEIIEDEEKRTRNFETNNLLNDWLISFSDILKTL
jgi:hypothetical protein